MSGFRIQGRGITRFKLGLLIFSVCFVYLLHDGISMATVKLKHSRQYIVKLTTWPEFVEERPDLYYDIPEERPTSNLCPKKSPHLKSYYPIDETIADLQPLTRKYIPYRPGGHFRPHDCISRTKTAIIVAYRNRERHLAVLLNHLIPFLVRQQAEFAIFVVEPVESVTFNRAFMMNIGFVEALKTNNFTCFVFHDVDRVPESDFNLYRCGNTPRHMMAAPSDSGYTLPYNSFSGGVMAVSRDIYDDINGHSNLYFGWGGEDDDLRDRLTWKGYKISRYPPAIARYASIFHKRDSGNDVSNLRYQLMWTTEKRLESDGLNSLKYKIIKLETYPLYTWVLVDIDVETYSQTILDYT